MRSNWISRVVSTIRESLSTEEHDFTDGSIRRAVVLLAIPMILELSLESVFAVVDMYFVGKLGPDAIATVGLTESLITLVYSLAIGLSTAATAIVARRVGEKDVQKASHAAGQAMLISVLSGIVLGALGMVFAADLLRFMGASASVVQSGAGFTRILMGGSVSIILLFLINGIFRGAGNAAIAMRSLWIASLINIGLCPILIGWYGVEGAAWATLIGRSSGVVYQLIALFRKQGQLKLSLTDFVPDWHQISSLVKLAWPATFQFIIASGSWIVLSRLVAQTGGTEASAGYQIAMRNVVFFILPAWGLSNAAATLVGQNLGASKPERAKASVALCTKYNAVFMALVMLFFLAFAEHIISWFSTDVQVQGFGTLALQIIGTGYVFYGIGMVMTQALNGAGDTRTPTWINFLGFWMFQVPLAWLLAIQFGFKSTGVFWAIPIAETAIALAAWLVFRKGKWQTQVV